MMSMYIVYTDPGSKLCFVMHMPNACLNCVASFKSLHHTCTVGGVAETEIVQQCEMVKLCMSLKGK